MHFYETLSHYQKGVNYHKSEDYYFYLNNRHLFSNIEMYHFLVDAKNEFDVIRANILIKAIQNKEKIEKAIIYAFQESKLRTDEVTKYIQKETSDLPYLIDGNNKIYIPVFSRSLNTLYNSQYGKLLQDPYSKLLKNFSTSCIDLFEMYNFSLYDSLFTKLVTIYRDEKVMVVYHFDFKTIYIINNQGRLDARIALFDKYLKNPTDLNIIKRIKPVIERYLDDDREGMYQALISNNLISEKMIYKIKHREYRFKRMLKRKAK